MRKRTKMLIRGVGLWLINLFASDIVDERTGKKVARLLLIPWRGRILVLGEGGLVIPEFRAQQRLTYWKREIGFFTHPDPDFPHEPRS